jgi:RNA polymerase sigma-70 factor (ECF subfamily)
MKHRPATEITTDTKPAPAAPDRLTQQMISYQAGSTDSFSELYSEMAPRLTRYITTFVRDGAVAEDLVQDTFLQLHRARHTYTPPRPVLPWMFAIARHMALMYLRSRKSRGARELPIDDYESFLVSEDQTRRLPDRLAVRRALETLRPDQRRTVTLHHVVGASYAEIGALMGTSAGAEKIRGHRGVKQLRQALDVGAGP